MKHYRIAIIAPIEYHEDNPVWRCFEDLRLAGHCVELLDPRRFPNIIDEAGKPNQKTLAPFLERFKPDYLSTGNEDVQTILNNLKQTDAGTDSPARRFVIFGYVGPNNFGDELIFSLICRQIERRFPGAHIQLIGHDPASALARHGVVSITCDQKMEADIMLRGASALVYMAGIMFDDPMEWTAGPIDFMLNPRSEIGGQLAFTLLAALYNIPSVYLGIGAGPLENPDAQALVNLEARNGAYYIPRDSETERLLLRAGVPTSSIDRKVDLAFSIERETVCGAADLLLAKHDMEAGSYIAITLREHRLVPEGFVQKLASALERIALSHGLTLAFIDLAPEDHAMHSAVVDQLDSACRACIIDPGIDTAAVVDLLARSYAVIAMRLHASIVANTCGVPTLGLDYNEKIAAYYEQMNRKQYLLPLDSESERIAEAFALMEECREADIASINLRASTNRLLAMEAFDAFERIVHNASPQPTRRRIFYARTVSIEEERLRGVEAELDRTRAERDAAQAELERVHASTTWHVGSVVTALPRALKRVKDR